jgi:hypothetical protein
LNGMNRVDFLSPPSCPTLSPIPHPTPLITTLCIRVCVSHSYDVTFRYSLVCLLSILVVYSDLFLLLDYCGSAMTANGSLNPTIATTTQHLLHLTTLDEQTCDVTLSVNREILFLLLDVTFVIYSYHFQNTMSGLLQ